MGLEVGVNVGVLEMWGWVNFGERVCMVIVNEYLGMGLSKTYYWSI